MSDETICGSSRQDTEAKFNAGAPKCNLSRLTLMKWARRGQIILANQAAESRAKSRGSLVPRWARLEALKRQNKKGTVSAWA